MGKAKSNNLEISLHAKERFVERFKGQANHAVSVINKAFKVAEEIDSDRKDARRWVSRDHNMIIITDEFKTLCITVYLWKKDKNKIAIVDDSSFQSYIEKGFEERKINHFTAYHIIKIEREKLSLEISQIKRDLFTAWKSGDDDQGLFEQLHAKLDDRIKRVNEVNKQYDELNRNFSRLTQQVSTVLGRDMSKECGILFFMEGENNV